MRRNGTPEAVACDVFFLGLEATVLAGAGLATNGEPACRPWTRSS